MIVIVMLFFIANSYAKTKEKNQVMIGKLRLVVVWITQIENKIRIQKYK